VPDVKPFRALRYAPDAVPDLAAVVAPPYDVIDAEARRRLAACDPRNVVRIDLPVFEPGDEPDERYRRAARQLSAWRSDGTLRRDPKPSLYPYEQAYRVPGSDVERSRRGVFAQVRLEAFGPGSAIRAHERTLAEPKEDRYRLLRATNVNTSPIVGLYEDGSGQVPAWLTSFDDGPVSDVVDEDRVRHRLWRVAADEAVVADVCDRIGAGPITLADGHHRYETALRYRDERMTGATPDGDPAWASILMLLLEPVAGPVTILPTHRVAVGLGDDGVEGGLGLGLGDPDEGAGQLELAVLGERDVAVADGAADQQGELLALALLDPGGVESQGTGLGRQVGPLRLRGGQLLEDPLQLPPPLVAVVGAVLGRGGHVGGVGRGHPIGELGVRGIAQAPGLGQAEAVVLGRVALAVLGAHHPS